MALAIGEYSEALEAHRKGNHADWVSFEAAMASGIPAHMAINDEANIASQQSIFECYIKDSVGDELADGVIRLLDYAGGFRLPLNFDRASINGPVENFGHNILCITKKIIDVFHAHEGIEDIESPHDTDMAAVEVGILISKVIVETKALCIQLDLDLWKHVEEKLKYNARRAAKHGKKY